MFYIIIMLNINDFLILVLYAVICMYVTKSMFIIKIINKHYYYLEI